MGKLHGGSGIQRVDVSTYTNGKGAEKVQINFSRDMALAAAADMHGPEWEAVYDVMAELLEREERGE
jgi:fructose/tagatose bisphosphate aldolase